MSRSPGDVTQRIVAAHIAALPHAEYEVGLLDGASERMHLRVWDGPTLLRSVGYLRAQNAQGRHIYVRPAGPHAFTLLDDLDRERLQLLSDAGFNTAAVVETSPGNYQAWINHGRTLQPQLSTAVAKHLASVFDADPSSADWRHFGRLAGFTNRKPKHQMANGHYPFVKLTEATGAVNGPTSLTAIQHAERTLEAERTEAAQRRSAIGRAPQLAEMGVHKSIEEFRDSPIYAGDLHRADLAFATYALSRGATPAQVEAAIRTRDLSHKGSEVRVRDYIDRTIEKALAARRS